MAARFSSFHQKSFSFHSHMKYNFQQFFLFLQRLGSLFHITIISLTFCTLGLASNHVYCKSNYTKLNYIYLFTFFALDSTTSSNLLTCSLCMYIFVYMRRKTAVVLCVASIMAVVVTHVYYINHLENCVNEYN